MRSPLLFALLLVPLAAGCLDPAAVAVPEGEAAGSWTYDGRDARGRAYQKVTRLIDVPGDALVIHSVRRGAGDDGATKLTLDERTLALRSIATSSGTLRFDPPYNVLSPRADHTYRGTVHVAGLEQTASATVDHRGEKRIEVPAGTFDAHHFVSEMRIGGALGTTQRTEIWYVPELRASVKTIVDGDTEVLVALGP